jgi:hypothetical protein
MIRKSTNRFSRESGVVADCYVDDYGRDVYVISLHAISTKRRFAFCRSEFVVIDTEKIKREQDRINREAKLWEDNHSGIRLIPVEGYNS